MKRLISTILALVCILSLAGCDLDRTTNNPGSVNNGTNSGITQGGITPGGDNVINEDGNLNIPLPENGTACVVDGDLWQTLLSEDAIRAAMKDNSITTLTSSTNADEYQMFYCAGGRYGSIQNGNYRSETVFSAEDGKAYIYNKASADASWVRTATQQSYDEYVTTHYTNGAMQFLSGLASVQSKAEYVKAEETYIIENHVVAMSGDETLTGTLKIQFANEKLYSICLTMTAEDQTATLRTLFGSVATPEIPKDFSETGSNISGISPDYNAGGHAEPPEATCTEQRWQRLFGERLIDNLMDSHTNIKISNGQQEYLYQMDVHFSRFVISANGSYQEILINRSERFQRDSKDGQWIHYVHHRDYETILNEKTAVLFQLLNPLEKLYKQTSFDSASKCFSLTDVTFEHGTFGSVTAEYAVTIQGGMVEQIKATFQSSGDTWTLLLEHNKNDRIEAPADFVEADNKESGKNK